MAGLPWKPIKLLSDLNREIEETFSQLIYEPWGKAVEHATPWEPAIDVYETDDAYLIEADLPGVAAENVELRLQGSLVTLCGSRRSITLTKSGRSVWVERGQGRFCRTFHLDSPVDTEHIETRCEQGIYHVRLPKKKRATKGG